MPAKSYSSVSCAFEWAPTRPHKSDLNVKRKRENKHVRSIPSDVKSGETDAIRIDRFQSDKFRF